MNQFSFLISMNKQQRRRGMVAAGLAGLVIMVFTAAVPVEAGVIADRSTLDAILGGNQILEDFESFDVPPGDIALLDIGGAVVLVDENSILTGLIGISVLDSQGPGLVEDGASYLVRRWIGDAYYGTSTRSVSSSFPLTIAYDVPVIAMGLDLDVFDGYPLSGGVVDVFDAAGGLIESVNLPTLPGASPTFFGYEAPEIGSVVLHAVDMGGWSTAPILDNHGYGVPEPSTLALLATGLIGLLCYAWRKRK